MNVILCVKAFGGKVQRASRLVRSSFLEYWRNGMLSMVMVFAIMPGE